MKISECFPSKYLKAADIPAGREVEVVIERAEFEEVDTGSHKPALYFQDKVKALVLNSTNAHVLSESFGDETDGWVGRRIMIFTTATSYKGRPTSGLRVRPIADPPQATPPDSQTPAAADAPAGTNF